MSKRDYGEGSISQRKDGTWTGRIFLGRGADGKQKVKAVYGKTEREVKKKMKEVQAELLKYDNVNLPRLAFSTLLRDWLNNVKRYELKDSSFDRLEATIENNIIPYMSHLQVARHTAIYQQSIRQRLFLLND